MARSAAARSAALTGDGLGVGGGTGLGPARCEIVGRGEGEGEGARRAAGEVTGEAVGGAPERPGMGGKAPGRPEMDGKASGRSEQTVPRMAIRTRRAAMAARSRSFTVVCRLAAIPGLSDRRAHA